ncbi:hypothetical protein [Streptomyces sp. G-G2]|uniref:hypothetical protein n=1 Tax=Streptomyces sp. G-G2 TaxID=3046201 RepID=UPI0024BB4E54|nr:hypothetical protein [Streptomyces sp. G-G2]MDJ0384022.1 hypothetical protein [Streptomyces sp. G-G2]
MAAHTNSQGPEGNYDPAGNTQMFRAFVDDAETARPAAVAASHRQQSSKAGLWLAVVVAFVVVVGAVAWLALG